MVRRIPSEGSLERFQIQGPNEIYQGLLESCTPLHGMTARLGFPLTRVHARLLAQFHWCGTDSF